MGAARADRRIRTRRRPARGTVDPHAQHPVRARPDRPWPAAGATAGQQEVDRESGLFEHGREQQVVLEAVATATLADELAFELVQVQGDGSATPWIQVFERDRGDMGSVDLRQRWRADEPDARHVFREVDHEVKSLPARAEAVIRRVSTPLTPVVTQEPRHRRCNGRSTSERYERPAGDGRRREQASHRRRTIGRLLARRPGVPRVSERPRSCVRQRQEA